MGVNVLVGAGVLVTVAVAVAVHADRIDVVLTDVRMPGLDGPSLVHQLASVLPTLRGVYMSGYADGRLDQEFPATGRSFLPKPFTVEQLTRTLADILS